MKMMERGRALGSTQRERYIDYAKALGLIGVLCTHLELPRGVLAPFEVPIFFVASGMLMRDRAESFGESARRYAKKLLVPFWIGMIVYTILELVRAHIIGYSDARLIVPAAINAIYGTPLVPDIGPLREFMLDTVPHTVQDMSHVNIILPTNCILWFLPTMFSATLLFSSIMRNRQKLPDAAWIVLLLAAAGLEFIPGFPSLPYCFSRGAIGAACMIAGRIMRETGIIREKSAARVNATIISAVVIFAALGSGSFNTLWIRHIYGPHGAASMVTAYALAIASSFLALRCCWLLECHPIAPINAALSTISRHSMLIYMLHMIVYNIFYALYVITTGAEIVPDSYNMNLFTTGHYHFRVFTLVATLAILTVASMILARRKSAR